MPSEPRQYRAGESLEDFCRACKTDRLHTVVATDAEGQPLRVSCGYCRSEHNYRGGPRVAASGPAASSADQTLAGVAPGPAPARPPVRAPSKPTGQFPIVSDRERSAPPIMLSDHSPDD